MGLVINGYISESNVRARFNGKPRNFYSDRQVKRNIYSNDVIDKKSAVTSGNLAPGAWVLPQRSGGMASFTLLKSEGEFSLNLVPSYPLDLSMSAFLTSGTLTLDSSVPFFADLSAALTPTTLDLAAAAGLSASLSASGVLDGTLGAIVSIDSAMTASLTAGNYLTAFANIECAIGGPTPLSPEGLSQTLLDENDIETGFSMRNTLRLMLSSLAGKLSGSPGTTITIKNVNDSKNRIVATVDANGNRTAVTYDTSD